MASVRHRPGRASASAWHPSRLSSTTASWSSAHCRPIAGTCVSSFPPIMSENGVRIRVLVVDDHDIVQWGFRLLLERQPWVERCLAASDGEEAIALAAKAKPHVALIDLFLGRQSGAELCEELCSVSPQTKILLISGAGSISAGAAR